MAEEVVRTEVISKDKDGTLEKVYFKKAKRTEINPETGKEHTKDVQPWEIRATGKKCQELRGAFKNSAPEMMHEGWKEWNSIGETKITRPDGSVDTVRADKEHLYRQQPGFCEKATKPTFQINGFGKAREQGIIRQRVKWTREGKETETTYADGRKTCVVEANVGNNHQ